VSSLLPLGIGYGDLVGDGDFEVFYQCRATLFALSVAQPTGQLAVEVCETAVAAEQRRESRIFARVGGRSCAVLAALLHQLH
jgi:hypothetical protein